MKKTVGMLCSLTILSACGTGLDFWNDKQKTLVGEPRHTPMLNGTPQNAPMSLNYTPPVRQTAAVAPRRAQLPANNMLVPEPYLNQQAFIPAAPAQYSSNNTGRRMPEFNRTAFGQGSADMLGPVPPPPVQSRPLMDNGAIASAYNPPSMPTQKLQAVSSGMPQGSVIPRAPLKSAQPQIPLPPVQTANIQPEIRNVPTMPPVSANMPQGAILPPAVKASNGESIQPAPIAAIDSTHRLEPYEAPKLEASANSMPQGKFFPPVPPVIRQAPPRPQARQAQPQGLEPEGPTVVVSAESSSAPGKSDNHATGLDSLGGQSQNAAPAPAVVDVHAVPHLESAGQGMPQGRIFPPVPPVAPYTPPPTPPLHVSTAQQLDSIKPSAHSEPEIHEVPPVQSSAEGMPNGSIFPPVPTAIISKSNPSKTSAQHAEQASPEIHDVPVVQSVVENMPQGSFIPYILQAPVKPAASASDPEPEIREVPKVQAVAENMPQGAFIPEMMQARQTEHADKAEPEIHEVPNVQSVAQNMPEGMLMSLAPTASTNNSARQIVAAQNTAPEIREVADLQSVAENMPQGSVFPPIPAAALAPQKIAQAAPAQPDPEVHDVQQLQAVAANMPDGSIFPPIPSNTKPNNIVVAANTKAPVINDAPAQSIVAQNNVKQKLSAPQDLEALPLPQAAGAEPKLVAQATDANIPGPRIERPHVSFANKKVDSNVGTIIAELNDDETAQPAPVPVTVVKAIPPPSESIKPIIVAQEVHSVKQGSTDGEYIKPVIAAQEVTPAKAVAAAPSEAIKPVTVAESHPAKTDAARGKNIVLADNSNYNQYPELGRTPPMPPIPEPVDNDPRVKQLKSDLQTQQQRVAADASDKLPPINATQDKPIIVTKVKETRVPVTEIAAKAELAPLPVPVRNAQPLPPIPALVMAKPTAPAQQLAIVTPSKAISATPAALPIQTNAQNAVDKGAYDVTAAPAPEVKVTPVAAPSAVSVAAPVVSQPIPVKASVPTQTMASLPPLPGVNPAPVAQPVIISQPVITANAAPAAQVVRQPEPVRQAPPVTTAAAAQEEAAPLVNVQPISIQHSGMLKPSRYAELREAQRNDSSY